MFKMCIKVTVEPENIPVDAFLLQFVDDLDFGLEAVEFFLVPLIECLGVDGIVVSFPQLVCFGEKRGEETKWPIVCFSCGEFPGGREMSPD